MGHSSGKELYQGLHEKLDGLSVCMPDHGALRALLRELYTPDEAALVVAMPWGLSRVDRIARISGEPLAVVAERLRELANKGLVVDLQRVSDGAWYFMPSPFVIGVYEFTMMRAGPMADHARRAQLFHEYLDAGDFFHANLGDGQQVFVARALPHQGTIEPGTEVLAPDSVEQIVEDATQFAVGVCSCRHEREHQSGRECAVPLETCTAMGSAAGYLVRHRLGRAISRSEMLEIVARSRGVGLVLSADNVKKDVGFVCHCCRCCCHLLQGINRFGYPNTITTSPFLPIPDEARCTGCGACVEACPIGALGGAKACRANRGVPVAPKLDAERCIGCGVCVTQCRSGALKLEEGARRRILPENSFERVLLQSLERGTLQNLVFDNPRCVAQAPMRALLGGVLRLRPVQRVLVSEAFRSAFIRGLASVVGF